jgi:hypothetical protein
MYNPDITWKTCEQTGHSYGLPFSRWNHVTSCSSSARHPSQFQVTFSIAIILQGGTRSSLVYSITCFHQQAGFQCQDLHRFCCMDTVLINYFHQITPAELKLGMLHKIKMLTTNTSWTSNYPYIIVWLHNCRGILYIEQLNKNPHKDRSISITASKVNR